MKLSTGRHTKAQLAADRAEIIALLSAGLSSRQVAKRLGYGDSSDIIAVLGLDRNWHE